MPRGAPVLVYQLLVITLVVARAASASPQLRLLPSSYDCPEGLVPPGASRKSFRTCTFRNLYLWHGMAHYILNSTAPEPPLERLGLRFHLWTTQEGADAVLGFVRPIRADAFLQQLAQAAAGGQAPEAVDSEIPLAYFWKARRLSPASNEYSCRTNPASLPGKVNMYHFLTEWMPALSNTLCEFFGHCSYADRSRLRVIDVWRSLCHERELYPPAVHHALACLSAGPLRHISGPALRNRLTLVHTAWMGLGPRCRGYPPGCSPPYAPGRLPPTPQLTSVWRQVACQCLGLDDGAVAPLRPLRLLVVDRLYASGRHILNVHSVVRALQRRYSPQHVQVELAYMEGLDLRQQAQLFGGASVVLHVHGASIAHYFVLPKRAVAAQVAPYREEWDPRFFTDLLQLDLANVSDIEVLDWANEDPSWVHVVTEGLEGRLWHKPSVARFLQRTDLFGELAATQECPEWMGEHRAACILMQRQINLVLDEAAAINLTDAAIARAFRKQGQAVPAELFARSGGSPTAGGGIKPGGGPLGDSKALAPAAAAAGRAEAAAHHRHVAAGSTALLWRLQHPSAAWLLLLGAAGGVVAARTVARLWRWKER